MSLYVLSRTPHGVRELKHLLKLLISTSISVAPHTGCVN